MGQRVVRRSQDPTDAHSAALTPSPSSLVHRGTRSPSRYDDLSRTESCSSVTITKRREFAALGLHERKLTQGEAILLQGTQSALLGLLDLLGPLDELVRDGPQSRLRFLIASVSDQEEIRLGGIDVCLERLVVRAREFELRRTRTGGLKGRGGGFKR